MSHETLYQLFFSQMRIDDLIRKERGARHVQDVVKLPVPAQTPNLLMKAEIVLIVLSMIAVVGCLPHGGEEAFQSVANGSQGLYAVWESMLRFQDGTAQVNLLLNRASPWLDVDSYLPHEGKVVLRNKQAKRIQVYLPRWVNKTKVKCTVDTNVIPAVFLGNYLLVEPVRPGSTILVTFPMQEETETFTLEDYGQLPSNLLGSYTYKITFRGNTAVQVIPTPSNEAEPKTWGGRERDAYGIYPAYQDKDLAKLRTPQAPMRKVDRVIADKIIPSW